MKLHHSDPIAAKRQAAQAEPWLQARRSAYPPIGDQLDALVALAAHLLDQGQALPAEVVAWVAACHAVKDKYPKPT